ncbi:hypothetical protein [Zavarzinia sp.]|uniref:hypothetical protein n=1 Tax=Zavarzinia sp. TaxID=2027920 RepID=UPI003BB4C8F7
MARNTDFMSIIHQMAPAPKDEESKDQQADAYAEALFLRAFTAYENDLEKLFLHYVTGGGSLKGVVAKTYFREIDETLARKITRAGYKFLSWAKPQEIRKTAENYIENGWPISEVMNSKSKDLADCEKIRNRIAHKSIESINSFNEVQRNLLNTERLFEITPGQLLRIRNGRSKELNISLYIGVMSDTLEAILDPPP